MRRREFVAGLGAASLPLAARAQSFGRIRRIAILVGFAETDPESPSHFAAFRQTLDRLGWKAGVNLRIDIRFGAGDLNKMQAFEGTAGCRARRRGGGQHACCIGHEAREPDDANHLYPGGQSGR